MTDADKLAEALAWADELEWTELCTESVLEYADDIVEKVKTLAAAVRDLQAMRDSWLKERDALMFGHCAAVGKHVEAKQELDALKATLQRAYDEAGRVFDEAEARRQRSREEEMEDA